MNIKFLLPKARAFVEKGEFRTMGETVCRHFKSQGKIRDIKL